MPTRRDAFLSTSRQAVLLLIALLAHVAFMATPLHAAMLQGPPAPHAMTMIDAGAPAQVEQSRAGEGHSGHCILRWTTSPRWSGVGLLVAAAPVGASSGPIMDPPLERPVARALGPSLLGDHQALLQVFRL